MCHQVGQRFSDHATLLKDGFLSCVKAENVIFFIVHSSLYKEFFTGTANHVKYNGVQSL